VRKIETPKPAADEALRLLRDDELDAVDGGKGGKGGKTPAEFIVVKMTEVMIT